jgi:hypothetical protein
MNGLVGFQIKLGNKTGYNSRGFLQILFFAEDILKEPNVNKIVFEVACFLVVCADYNAEKQIAAASVINDKSQFGMPTLSSFQANMTEFYKNPT